jgi:hypothetical protein
MKKLTIFASIILGLLLLSAACTKRIVTPSLPIPTPTATETATPTPIGCFSGNTCHIATYILSGSPTPNALMTPIPTSTPDIIGPFPPSILFSAPVTNSSDARFTIIQTPLEWSSFWSSTAWPEPVAPTDFSDRMIVLLHYSAGGMAHLSWGIHHICFTPSNIEIYASGAGGGAPCPMCLAFPIVEVFLLPKTDLPSLYISTFLNMP